VVLDTVLGEAESATATDSDGGEISDSESDDTTAAGSVTFEPNADHSPDDNSPDDNAGGSE